MRKILLLLPLLALTACSGNPILRSNKSFRMTCFANTREPVISATIKLESNWKHALVLWLEDEPEVWRITNASPYRIVVQQPPPFPRTNPEIEGKVLSIYRLEGRVVFNGIKDLSCNFESL
jgi:hypothetical protein|tara:strand:+ start:1404 stop:1766 length:363 start_codon:yes stop_codon:yes gene_type:complete